MSKVLCETANMSDEEWRKARMSGLGASDAATCMFLNPYQTPYALWAEKTGRTSGFEGNEYTRWGQILEDPIARSAAETFGFKVRRRRAILQHDEHPWMICNIDRWAYWPDGRRDVLECKFSQASNRWEDEDEEGGELEPPVQYVIQAQHQMAITGDSRCLMAVLLFNPFRPDTLFTIDRNEGLISDIIEAERQFWHYVESDTPPPITPDDIHLDAALRTLSDDQVARITDEVGDADDVIRDHLAAKEEEKAANDTVKHTRVALQNALTEAGVKVGFTPKWAVSLSAWQQRTFDHKTFLADHPEFDGDDRYWKKSPRSRLTITPLGRWLARQKVADREAFAAAAGFTMDRVQGLIEEAKGD